MAAIILETSEGVSGMQKTFTAIIHQEDKWYVAECPETGTASQGTTLEECKLWS